jgi:hypothetical protein
MNRSFSSSFKISSKQNLNLKKNITVRYQTLFKTRGDQKTLDLSILKQKLKKMQHNLVNKFSLIILKIMINNKKILKII